MKSKIEKPSEETPKENLAPQNQMQVVASSPAAMIQAVMSKNGNMSDLRELLQIQKEWEANEARKAFNKAMSDFKATPIEISKDKKVGFETDKGFVGYSHASLYNIVEKITAGLSQFGLSVSFRPDQKERISVTTRISHTLGHFEEITLSADSDKTGSKNSIQAIGSTITYLSRYGILAITGLATKDQDDDGKKSEMEFVDEKQASIIEDYLEALKTKIDRKKFLDKLGFKSVLEIPKSKYSEVVALFKTVESRN